MNRTLQVVAQLVGVPALVALIVLFNVVELAYMVDLVLAGWLFFMFFFGPAMLTVIYWAATAAYAPLGVAMGDESSTTARAVGIAVAPAGIGLGSSYGKFRTGLSTASSTPTHGSITGYLTASD